MASRYTLQINLSPGDLLYGERTVPALIEAHRRHAERVLLVVDLCRPERTISVDPDSKFPIDVFRERCEQTRRMADSIQRLARVDEVVLLEADDPLHRKLNRRWLGIDIRRTHDFSGCALTAYFAGFDLPTTRHVVHYDADILLYQSPDFDWGLAGMEAAESMADVLAVSPLLTPPFDGDAPEREPGLPQTRVPGGWVDDWFSTRCLMIDRDRLAKQLPLVRSPKRLAIYTARWVTGRGWPPSPELLIHQNAGDRGMKRLILNDKRAWILHPNPKNEKYYKLLDGIMESVSRGEVPEEQRGLQDLKLDAWERRLMASR